MTDVRCPRCETLASKAGGKPYCPSCGWNAEVAQQLAQENLKILKFGLGIVTILTVSALVLVKVIGANFDFPWPLPVLLIAGIWMLYSGFREWKRVGEVKAFRGRMGESVVDSMGGRGARGWSAEVPKKYSYLLTVARPRTVRLSHQGKLNVVGTSLVGVLFLMIGLLLVPETLSRHGDWLFNLFWILGIFIFGIVIMSQLGKEAGRQSLLREGEMFIGKILSQASTGGKHPKSQITYAYQDSAGNVHRGSDVDGTKTLYEEMSVVVFYNPTRPQDHVAECATIWEVVSPAIGT